MTSKNSSRGGGRSQGSASKRKLLSVPEIVAIGVTAAFLIIVFVVADRGPWSAEMCGFFGGEYVCRGNFRATALGLLPFTSPLVGVIALYVGRRVEDLARRQQQ